MNLTPKGFKKPLATEAYDVEIQNSNMDLVEELLTEVEQSVENIEIPVMSVNGKVGEVTLNASDIEAETPEGAQGKVTIHEGISATTSNKGHVELATTAEATAGTDTIRAVTPAGLKAALAALVAAAPSTLDTLDELAQALGDDPNFATTITNLIGQVQTSVNEHKENIATETERGHIKFDDMPGLWKKIDDIEIGANTALIDISIPQGYTELRVIGKSVNLTVTSTIGLRINGELVNYKTQVINYNSVVTASSDSYYVVGLSGNEQTMFEINIIIYKKLALISSIIEDKGSPTTFRVSSNTGQYTSSLDIILNSIQFVLKDASRYFVAGSTFEVWGR